MHKLPIFALASLALAATPLAGVESPFPVTEIFPVEPGINSERGFAVAVDGNWLAMGAHREDHAGGVSVEKDAGAVYLFEWSGTTWEQRAKLFADPPQRKAHLGFALAMRDGVLAAGAPGEGAVYVFARQGDAWDQVKKLTAAGQGAGTFGRSLALDGGRLAVGAVAVHGTKDGAVYLYDVHSWKRVLIRPQSRQKGERFGTAVSLAGDVLVVGAPGYNVGTDPPADDAGAVYVFQPESSRWIKKTKLFPPGRRPQAGQQFGAAVATDGSRIFVGAPTADPHLEDSESSEEGNNAGAVYGFVRRGSDWKRQDPDVERLAAGDQLGTSLALSGDLLVVGAPAPPPGTGEGTVHLFRRDGSSWPEVRFPVAGNAEVRDLAGFAVAVDGERVAVGGVLGDQGSGGAGAAWSFACRADSESCREEAEAVARDPATGPFGASVAVTDEALAVGAPSPIDESAGVVYTYRPARKGWRQDARLTAPHSLKDSAFGSAVALAGRRLAVGAPRSRVFPEGAVYLFSRERGFWDFEIGFRPEGTSEEVAFGASVAVEDDTVAIGAPGGFLPATYPTVFVLEKLENRWTTTGRILHDQLEGRFGSAISLHGEALAIGAPGEGAVYVVARGAQGWPNVERPQRREPLAAQEESLGSAVAVGDRFLATGAPDSGTVRIFEKVEEEWHEGRLPSLPQPEEARGFGASVSVLGNLLAAGAPDPERPGHAFHFELGSESGRMFDLMSLDPQPGDLFGTSVAVSNKFIVVTSPGRGDRATFFTLPHEEIVEP